VIGPSQSLYLTTHNTHKGQILPLAGFKTAIPATKRLQTPAAIGFAFYALGPNKFH
jgi:hypothetical protein